MGADLDLLEALTTTRSVRRHLDLDAEIGLDAVRACLEVALQAPIASNRERRRFVVVADAARRRRIGELFRRTWTDLTGEVLADGVPAPAPAGPDEDAAAAGQRRVLDGARRLAGSMDRVPVHLVACVRGTLPAAVVGPAASDLYGSIFPTVWSFQLALRAHGLVSCLTTAVLRHEPELRELLALPDDVHPVAVVAIAKSTKTAFGPAPRVPLDDVMRIDRWERPDE